MAIFKEPAARVRLFVAMTAKPGTAFVVKASGVFLALMTDVCAFHEKETRRVAVSHPPGISYLVARNDATFFPRNHRRDNSSGVKRDESVVKLQRRVKDHDGILGR